jgi:leader peptidase (prepilin peptidase) / N-methyltransferase
LTYVPVGVAFAAVITTGLIVGSFLNVCIHRIPRKQSIVWPASRCASCERPLAWFENLPVLSYAALGGRCRTCGTRISIRYPIVELVTAAAFAFAFLAFGPTPLFLVRAIFASAMIVLFAIDLEHHLLPNVVTYPGIIAGSFASLFLPPGPIMALAGIVAGGGFLWLIIEVWLRLRGVEAMGFGDVKMLAMIGAFLGLKLTILTFILSSLLGGLIGLFVIVTRRGGLATALPYGTMLAVAGFVASVAGERIIDWYVHLYL